MIKGKLKIKLKIIRLRIIIIIEVLIVENIEKIDLREIND